MRTLLIESSPGVGAEAAAALSDAGHPVVRCHEEGRPTFPCGDLAEPGSCPLHGPGAVDVVLSVRHPDDAEPTAAEAGVTCALRAGVPVVVLGDQEVNPFAALTVPVSDDDPVAAVVAAYQAGKEVASAPLRAEVARLLEDAGVSADGVGVDVERQGERYRIAVTVPADLPITNESIATHVHARFREAGLAAQTIDVAVRSLG
jgi:hypothetical protein